MYLKRLEIVGFKSFAQKTALDFTSGISRKTALLNSNSFYDTI